MIVFSGQVILLDVEGTTSSIDFVYDVLFGYAKEHIAAFLQTHSDDDEIYNITQELAQETSQQTSQQSPKQSKRRSQHISGV